ncbi:hypothetical protein SAMN05444410_1089 [Hydrobacter penzbergensis]|uniref:Uncharacterized protein n=1 Tax=Hydrobacter penzbergensis TaxID=1235997 RepID=A0A8X8ICU6_9BACT|nr:hypothetical protein SAMN05444410_1089 [Hydrobacter penzbergensis]
MKERPNYIGRHFMFKIQQFSKSQRFFFIDHHGLLRQSKSLSTDLWRDLACLVHHE